MSSSQPTPYKNSRISALFLVILLSLLSISVYGQQPIQVQVTVMQPVTPYLPQLAADVRGGQYGNVEESLSNKLIVRVTNTSSAPLRIKLSARIERMSPSPASVSLRPDYQPAQPLILGPQQTIQLDRQLIEETFGNFSRGKLVFNNLSLSALRQNDVNYKLPEGIYRVCVTAYDYDKAGQSAPLSMPGTSCAVFNICYTASAPQFTMPVSTMIGGQPGFTAFTPQSPQIQFVWTPPASTCGLPLGMITYDLEIREMYAGQALNDAKNNPFVFRQQALPTNMFILDTLKYPHVFQAGKQYIVRVKANMQKMANSPLEIANQGYSELAAITYSPKPTRPPIWGGGLDIPDDMNIVSTSNAIATGSECEGIEPPTNMTLTQEEIVNKDIQVGAFTMHVNEARRDGDHYTGTGQITWKPIVGKTLLLAVTFADIQINTDYQLVSGVVNSARNSTIPEWANLSGPEDIPYLSKQMDAVLADLNKKINTAINPIRQATGESAVSFPLGLNEVKLAGTTSTLAIMSISFTSTGTDMRMLFNMNMPEASGWLSLAGTGFCIQPDGFSGEKGILYLPSDRDINLDGTVFTLQGALATDGSLDTTKTTYLKWNADGFERLFVKANLTLPDELKAVDALGKRTGEQVKMTATFDFNEWDNWIANLSTTGDFEIDNLPGFIISMNEGLYYDHSVVRNSQPKDGIVWPIDQGDKKFIGKDAGYQGIYMKKLTVKLPVDFVGIGGDAPDVTFTDLFINGENGLWADINAQNLLDINEGKIGGWAFSIDQFTLPIKKWVPQAASMNGKIGLPISTEKLNYTCNLNTAKERLSYQFKVETQNQYKIPMWAAHLKLRPATNITINKEPDKDVQVGVVLDGVLSITVNKSPKIVFNAVDIQGMQIANYNMNALAGQDPQIGEMYFNSGNIKFGSLERVPEQANAYVDPTFFDQGRMLAKGPAAPMQYPPFSMSEEEEVSGSSVAGFGISAKGFKPLVDITGEGLKVGFSFDLGLSLGFDAIKIKNITTLSVYGVIAGTSSNPIPVDEVEVELNKITLDGDFGPVTVSGSLAFREGDATWGDGISAEDIHVGFPPGIDVKVSVMFGNVKGYQYFGLGGAFYSSTGIGAIGPVVINGFGGGFYYNMALTKPEKGTPVEGSVVSFEPSGDGYGLTANLDLSYVNATVLKASVEIALSHDNLGGFSFALEGEGDIISDGAKDSEGIAHGIVKMQYANECFDGYFDIDANVLNSVGIEIPVWIHAGYKKEVPPRDHLSDEELAALRSDKSKFDFWLYIGRPDEGVDEVFGETYSKIRVALFGDKDGNPEKGPFYTLQMFADAYFCIGSQLPAFPELPLAVRSFMQDGDLSAKKKATEGSIMNAVQGGAGFMFGAGVHGRAEIQLAIFYANAQVDIGFDVALKHYTGSPCGSPTFGMNGWYARGQFYAYLAMDVGFQIDVWFWEGRVSLADLAIGATLEAGLPNPTWMDGRIRIKGSVLGGMVRVNTGCRFTIGERCADGDPLANIQMISEMGPAEEDVSVYANPYISFSVPMSDGEGKTRELSFEVEEADKDGMAITDENGETKVITRVYKFFVWDKQLAQFKNSGKGLKDKIDGTELPNLTKQISDDGFTMSLMHDDVIMKDHKQYGIYVKCMAQEKVGGIWRTPKEYDHLKEGFTQDSVVLFTSGSAPDSISEYNVVNSYPLNGQNFLLKNEFAKKGRIKLYGGYNSKFFGLEDATPVRKLTFVSKDGAQKIESTFNPVSASNTIEFIVPEELKNSTVYYAYLTVEDKNFVPKKSEVTIQGKDLRKPGELSIDMTGYTANISKTVFSLDNTASHTIPAASPRSRGKAALNQATVQQMDFSRQNVLSKIGTVMEEQDSLMLLGRKTEVFQPKSGRIIYQMTFGTSRYNTFKEKLNAYGEKLYGTTTNKQSRIYLQATNNPKTEPFSFTDQTIAFYDLEIPVFDAGEGFDEWELVGMKRQVGGDGESLSLYVLPPLLRVSTGFAQDRFGSDALYRKNNIYDPVANLEGANDGTPQYLTVDFGDPLTIRASNLKYSMPTKATSIDNVGYYKLLNAKGETKYVSSSSFTIPGVQLNIVDQTNRFLARDFALMKLADYWYNRKQKDMRIYYDALSGDPIKVMELYYTLIGKEGTPFTEENKNLSAEEFRNATFLQYLTTFGTIAAGSENESVRVNIDNDKVSYWDKWYYAIGFWMGAPAYKQMEIIRKAAFKPIDYTNNSQNKYVKFTYGYPSSYDYSLDQYNTVQEGFDYKKYPLFPSALNLQKPLEFISGAAMVAKKEQARKDYFAGPKNATGISAQPIGTIPGITPPVNVRQGIDTEHIRIKGRTWPPVIFIKD